MNTVLAINTIASDPQIRNGQPVIAGTRIRMSDVAASHVYRGLSAEELAANFELKMGQVHAALAYYFENRVAIDAQMRAEAANAERLLSELEVQKRLIRIE